MAYALYDNDSALYEQGKIVLSKNARDKQKELSKKIAVPTDGYIETYLVNETFDDVLPAYRQRQVLQVQYHEYRAIDCPRDPWNLSR